MKIAITGGTGFIGEPLVRALTGRGDDVSVLSRNPGRVRAGRGVAWTPGQAGEWTGVVADADAVIHLAGESIADGRWTEDRKRTLVASRIDTTRSIVEAMRVGVAKDRAFISASAVGYYGSRGDETLDEGAARGNGFLAELTAAWEREAETAQPIARVVIARLGIVLGKDGGALAKMLLPFRMGVGGRIGNGKQWMSWVDREDVVRFLLWAVDSQSVRGVYNVTAPDPVRNAELTAALGKALHRPAVLPVPPFALRILFGEMADEALLAGQRAVPSHALREGFQFSQPNLPESLARNI